MAISLYLGFVLPVRPQFVECIAFNLIQFNARLGQHLVHHQRGYWSQSELRSYLDRLHLVSEVSRSSRRMELLLIDCRPAIWAMSSDDDTSSSAARRPASSAPSCRAFPP